jgi:hypothetical protein
MNGEAAEAIPGLSAGQVRPRWHRLIKNGRWYLVRRDGITKIGWGDVDADDLDAVATHLGGREAVVVLPENPAGGQHLPHELGAEHAGWCWYDRPDCRPVTLAALAVSAHYAVLNNEVRYVTDDQVDHVTVTLQQDWRGQGTPQNPTFPTITVGTLHARLRLLADPHSLRP